MQATVFDFDVESLDGHVILDDGRVLPFSAEAFIASGLRLLRPGQRIRVELSEEDAIAFLTIATLP